MLQASKKSGDRQPSDLWNTHIRKGKKISKGHYEEICNYCSYSKHKGSLQNFEEHLANNCPNVPKRTNEINKACIKAFVICSISWKTISNPFFIDFLKTLQPGYIPPSHEVLSGHLFSQEVSAINVKIIQKLDYSNNLALEEAKRLNISDGYGKKRNRLGLHKIENIQKFASYYNSHAKQELPYYSIEKTNDINKEVEEDEIFDEEDNLLLSNTINLNKFCSNLEEL
ncbi:43624_t:CDS:2 [Gigaspora margarita]|uniref:43624_t:CDS:1 n=1 Tax=Gigaspora margarita TaxID=4874 RepID=A0ABN7UIG4_GIGMA|nr:43624_t:CDS:2 [Gigaspora margarita]